ncbi:hypothetical protein FLJC2902T_29900 [Flavobacterium limnosediminis JC2902]|uniref:Peptidase S9 prolyl oligopeptidase catalytic domain-containing protein n=1 Tax=Flavobacterium limnosediminis JC2902 TaxID=1341181 RepID=V6SI78_9FLAO|nr:prolyl oligopeptidase family serine peptidase [Flavobacterium limnosediminis]ESU25977.1 hypothetical protein FLJC2902T_29900 [Flavobacterium limnosediminis JC2902]
MKAIKYHTSFFLFLLVVACPLWGQVKQKKHLTAQDYHLWSELHPDKISDNGNWVSYALRYESGEDTLFVKNRNGKTTAFPKGKNGNFSKEEWFVCLQPDNKLNILDIKTGKQQTVSDVADYKIAANGNYLAILKTTANNTNSLVVQDWKGQVLKSIENVKVWYPNPQNTAIAYVTAKGMHHTVEVIHTDKSLENNRVAIEDNLGFHNFAWQSNGQAFCFLHHPLEQQQKQNTKGKLFRYTLKDKKLVVFNPDKQVNFPKDYNISANDLIPITMSEDGQRVFFGVKKEQLPRGTSKATVQVWNTHDKSLYPLKNQFGGWDKIEKLSVWYPDSNRFFQIADNDLPHVALNGNQTYAITSNQEIYEPQEKREADRDFYGVDLQTGTKKLLLKKYSGANQMVLMSPKGKYITYFKESNWFIYDIKKDKHTNITQSRIAELSKPDFELNSDWIPYGNPGFTKDEKSVLIYDKYDIWEVSVNGSVCTRLTNGKEKEITFRISEQSAIQKPEVKYDGNRTGLFDTGGILLLQATGKDHVASGYYYWQRSQGEEPIVYKEMRISRLQLAGNKQDLMYVEENFDVSPRLVISNIKNQKQQDIVNSNPQQQDYFWGKSVQIKYKNASGIPLTGVLFYPANYSPDKKYPMVVHVYQKQSREFHKYLNPSLHNNEGWNHTNFTTKGYFILYPDIVYEIGNTGASAADCTTAATQAVIDMGVIDRDKIGLIGHSFGGFETNFIITQTDMFAAAVSGAGLSDFVSAYLGVSWNYSKPDFWRFEHHQFRMGKSLFEDTEGYLRNSPVLHTPKVNTPLLIWTGELDLQINAKQSYEFYLALRRLKKKSTMLIYPGEEHALSESTNTEDLTNKIEAWFDYYLKGKEFPSWMAANYND